MYKYFSAVDHYPGLLDCVRWSFAALPHPDCSGMGRRATFAFTRATFLVFVIFCVWPCAGSPGARICPGWPTQQGSSLDCCVSPVKILAWPVDTLSLICLHAHRNLQSPWLSPRHHRPQPQDLAWAIPLLWSCLCAALMIYILYYYT